MAASQSYINRRLHSLLGVVPIGLFLIIHFVVNHYAVDGAPAFNKAAGFMENLPFLVYLEWIFIYLPLLFHGIYGLYIAFQTSSNVGSNSFFRNWMYLFQRISGVFLVIFIGWHVWQTRIQMAMGEPLNFQMMADILSNPFFFWFYIIGVISAVFHFSNGLWSFCVTWGLTITPRSQLIVTYVTLAIFIILSVIGIRAVLAFTNPQYAMLF
ncbi:MAG TPA: succinate dehydrogenase cytochrome b558 subunit [Bacillales bacterium]|nr:succinate dehydrogenase cytochrome b558 subunit [Bacillales bacterium]